jgi:hypothetical protein
MGMATLAPPEPGVSVEWSEEAAARVLAAIVAGTPIYKIPSLPGMPCVVTLYEWKEKHPEWANALARARASRADRLVDEGLGIVDSCDGDSSSQVGKAREQAGYRRWLAGCLDRETYGERPAVAVTIGQVGIAFGRLSAPKGSDED